MEEHGTHVTVAMVQDTIQLLNAEHAADEERLSRKVLVVECVPMVRYVTSMAIGLTALCVEVLVMRHQMAVAPLATDGEEQLAPNAMAPARYGETKTKWNEAFINLFPRSLCRSHESRVWRESRAI